MEASDTDSTTITPADVQPVVIGSPDPVAAALDALKTAAAVEITVAGGPGADLPKVVLGRESVERRVLGHVTDEVDRDALGPRNTLAAIYHAVSTDRNTTNPPNDKPRLNLDGLDVAQALQVVHDILEHLVTVGLLEQREDTSYALTDLGHYELAN